MSTAGKRVYGIKWESGKSSFCLAENWTQRVSTVASEGQVIELLSVQKGIICMCQLEM
jgi:hypothetical protein